MWQEILFVVKDYDDWLSLTPIVLGYQAFLRRIFSFSDERVAQLISAQTQALTEFVTTWIDGRHDLMPILW
jgi:hypothetical protein